MDQTSVQVCQCQPGGRCLFFGTTVLKLSGTRGETCRETLYSRGEEWSGREDLNIRPLVLTCVGELETDEIDWVHVAATQLDTLTQLFWGSKISHLDSIHQGAAP